MMDVLSENAVSQGMVLASLVGGIALASIAQLVSAFPNRGEQTDGGKSKDVVTAAITWLAVAATVMMINVWSGIIFFMDDGSDRRSIAGLFYGGLLIGVVFFALGIAAATTDPGHVRWATRGRGRPGAHVSRLI